MANPIPPGRIQRHHNEVALNTNDERAVEQLMRLVEQTAELWPAHMASGDPTADLYDDARLPA